MSTPRPVPELALLLAGMPQVAERLIAVHTPGHDGYCTGCYLPQGGPNRWPCVLHGLAVLAREVTERADRNSRR